MKIYDEQHNFAGYLVKDKDGYCLSGASDSSVKNVNLFRKRIKTGMPWNKELLFWLAVCEAMAFIGCLVWLCVPTPAKDNVYCFLFVPYGLSFILPPFCMLMRFIITFICGIKKRMFFIPATLEFVEAGFIIGFLLIYDSSDSYDYLLLIGMVCMLIIIEIMISWLLCEFVFGKKSTSSAPICIVASCFVVLLHIFSELPTKQIPSIVQLLALFAFLYHLIGFICYACLIHKMNFVKPSVKES